MANPSITPTAKPVTVPIPAIDPIAAAIPLRSDFSIPVLRSLVVFLMLDPILLTASFSLSTCFSSISLAFLLIAACNLLTLIKSRRLLNIFWSSLVPSLVPRSIACLTPPNRRLFSAICLLETALLFCSNALRLAKFPLSMAISSLSCSSLAHAGTSTACPAISIVCLLDAMFRSAIMYVDK